MTIGQDLDRTLGAYLADGTALEDLIDREGRTLGARLMNDPGIHELEMRKVFTKNWVFVAHESELLSAGDFVARYIGLDPVIVARGDDSKIRVLLNSCSHRGGRVCRSDSGNTSDFRCPYHGWIYDNAGNLTAVAFEREAYGSLDKERYGLRTARVATYGGLVFATFDAELPSLEEYLGDFKFYLDMNLRFLDGYWEVAGPPQRWVVDANWKFGAEQFAGDGYHVPSTHRSAAEVMGNSAGDGGRGNWGVNFNEPRYGHGGRCLGVGLAYGLSPEQLAESGLSPAQQDLLATRMLPVVGTVFPNCSFLFNDVLGGPVATIRTWNPRGPEKMEVMSWVLVARDAPEEVKEERIQSTTWAFSASGYAEGDDAEVWAQVQRSIKGPMGREQRFTYLSTTPHSVKDWRDGQDFPGPGEVHLGFTTEDNQWNWWLRWFECMNRLG